MQEKVGALIFQLMYMRPDTAFHECRLSTHIDGPIMGYSKAVKCLLRYLTHIIELGLSYNAINHSETEVKYFDADWTRDWAPRESTMQLGCHDEV